MDIDESRTTTRGGMTWSWSDGSEWRNHRVIHYYVADVERGGLRGPEMDVYIVRERSLRRHHPYAWFVILMPAEPGWPEFLFPPGRNLEGIAFEDVVGLALDAYAETHYEKWASGSVKN